MKKIVIVMIVAFMLLVSSLAFAGEKVVYTVKAGDTLGELMFTWKVQGIDIKEIHQWNQNLGTQVAVGQQIIYCLPDRPVAKITSEEAIKQVEEAIATLKDAQKIVKEMDEERNNRIKKQQEERINNIIVYAVLFVLIVIMLFFLRNKKQPAVKAQKETAKAEPQPVTDRIFFVPVEENGLYEAEVEYNAELDRYFIPFCHKNGGDRIWKNKEGDARRNVQQCWRQKNKYGDQIDKLMVEGKIRQINNQNQAKA